MEKEYKFFDFININLDLEIAECKAVHQLLNTFEYMYYLEGSFVDFKNLVSTSKSLHKEIKIYCVARDRKATAAHWDALKKSIYIELLDLNFDKNVFDFCYAIIFELSNSINQYFVSVANIISIYNISKGNPDIQAFLCELAEYDTQKIAYKVIKNLSRDIEYLFYQNHQFPETTCSIFLKPFVGLEIKIQDSFKQYWKYVNENGSAYNRNYKHADYYRESPDHVFIEKIQGDKLDLIEQEIIQEFLQGNFNINQARQNYFKDLEIIVADSEWSDIIKLQYYLIYQLIMQDGRKPQDVSLDPYIIDYLAKANWAFEVLDVFVAIAEGEIVIKELINNSQQEFIKILFEIFNYIKDVEEDCVDVYNSIAIIEFLPKLQRIDLDGLNNQLLKNQCEKIIGSFIKVSDHNELIKSISPIIQELFINAQEMVIDWELQKEEDIPLKEKLFTFFSNNLIKCNENQKYLLSIS